MNPTPTPEESSAVRPRTPGEALASSLHWPIDGDTERMHDSAARAVIRWFCEEVDAYAADRFMGLGGLAVSALSFDEMRRKYTEEPK